MSESNRLDSEIGEMFHGFIAMEVSRAWCVDLASRAYQRGMLRAGEIAEKLVDSYYNHERDLDLRHTRLEVSDKIVAAIRRESEGAK